LEELMTSKIKGIDFDEILAKESKDPEFRHHFEQRRLIHEVALIVRGMREASGLTQAELAEMISSSQPMIARLEKGLDQRTPRWDTLNRIAIALGKQLTLVFHDPQKSQSPLVEVKGKYRPSRTKVRQHGAARQKAKAS